MRWNLVFGVLFFVFVVVTLSFYWIIPSEQLQFREAFSSKGSSEFSLENNSIDSSNVLFYEWIRFPSKKISYSIEDDCSLQKKQNMKRAFDIIENLTVLEFYSSKPGQIKVSCQEKSVINKGMFIAGEGGPTEIVSSGKYHLILDSEILLIRDSSCFEPNVAIHELLHVIGFNHSENKNNIMYPYSKCSQTIGNEIPLKINELYLDPSLSDLVIDNVSAVMRGRFLDFSITLRNIGLIKSLNSTLKIYADDKEIKEYPFNSLEAGSGIKLDSTNIFVKQFGVETISFEIVGEFEELNKENNKKELEQI